MDGPPAPRWLSADLAAAWIETVMLVTRLPAALDAQLHRDAGLTLYEYLVLSALSMAPDRTHQMSDLAALTSASLSRLSHVAARLERRGYVTRTRCPGGVGRATNATLTEAGWAKVEAAAPGHVEAVRELLIDPLTADQIVTLQAIGRRLRSRLDPAGTFAHAPTLDGSESAPGLDHAIVDRLLTTTRAVRRRLDFDRPVAPLLIDQCLDLALQAPNGSGAEPWRWIVVYDAAQRARLGAIYARSSADYLASLRADDPDLDEGSPTMVSSRTLWERLGEVPVLVVPCVQREPAEATTPHDGYEQASLWGSIFPAVWSFQLACRSRGLGTCLVTSLLRYEAEVREVLRLPDDLALAGVVAVAHTTGDFAPARRRPLDEVRRVDRW